MAKKIKVKIKSSTFKYIYDGVAYNSGDTLMIDESRFNSYRMEIVEEPEKPKEVEETTPKEEEQTPAEEPTVETPTEEPVPETSDEAVATTSLPSMGEEPPLPAAEEPPAPKPRRRKKSTS